MLTNYDAKAVAEVMGLAFLRSSKDDFSATATSKAAKGGSRSPTSALDHDFVIRVDDATMLIVEIKTNNTLAPFSASRTFTGHLSDFKSRQVSLPTPVFIEKGGGERSAAGDALRHVAEWLAGGDKAKVSALEWGVVPKTTLERTAKSSSHPRRVNEPSASRDFSCMRAAPSARRPRRASYYDNVTPRTRWPQPDRRCEDGSRHPPH